MKTRLLWLCALVLATCVPVSAAPEGILANQRRLKPSIRVAYSRVDKLVKVVSEPAGPDSPALYACEVRSGVALVSAKVEALMGEFDFSAVTADTVLGLSVGDFTFRSKVGAAAVKTLGQTGKAQFYFVRQIPVLTGAGEPKKDGQGNAVVLRKTLGSLSFAWSAKARRLTATLSGMIPEGGALEGEVLSGIASGFFDLAGQNAGTVGFENEPVAVSVTFGEATGSRNAWAKVKVGTKKRTEKANPGDAAQDFLVNSVVLVGEADTTGPAIVVKAPARVNDSGTAAMSVTLTDRAGPTSQAQGWAAPTLVVLGNPSPGSFDQFGYPIDANASQDAAGVATMGYVGSQGAAVQAGAELSARGVGYLAGTLGVEGLGQSSNVVMFVATDSEGNRTVVRKTVAGVSAGGVDASMPAMVLIPGGSYTRGDVAGDSHAENWWGPADAPVQTIDVSAFSIGATHITLAQWGELRTWGASRGYTDLIAGKGKAATHPVCGLRWYDAVKWCNAASEREMRTPAYKVNGAVYRAGQSDAVVCDWTANGYRLPTEAEWEKAARGGLSGKRFPWGDTISHSQANYLSGAYGVGSYDVSPTRGYHPTFSGGRVQYHDGDDRYMPYTSPVGSFAANGYGLYDMAGNVFQWCWDWYGVYVEEGDPRGRASGTQRVARGGIWYFGADACAAGFRWRDLPGTDDNEGLRVVRSVVP